MPEPPKPIKRPSVEKYNPTAKVRWKIKGNPDGPVYQGQQKIIPCKTCR